MSVIQANSSVTHTYGNVSCVAMDFISKYFEKDFFKVKHISTKLAYKQLDVFRSKNEFWKLRKPMLIVRPRIDANDDSTFFYGSTMVNRVHNVKSPMEYGDIVTLLEDNHSGVKLGFLWNRTKIYYDVVIIVESYNEQLNLHNYLLNAFVPDAPFPLKTPLESYIPRNIIYSIADYLGIERTDTATILEYMNTHSNIPITYKFKNGSGNEEYFGLYGTNIEAILSQVDTDDGQERGMMTDTFTLSFTLSLEFYNMAMYYLALRDKDNRFIKCPPDRDIKGDGTLVPLFSIPLLDSIELERGWRLYSAPSLFVGDRTEDITPLNRVIDNQLKEILKQQRFMSLPQDFFIKFRLFRNNEELDETNGDFKIDISDLDNPKLIIYNGHTKSTYRLFILINNAYIHSITADFNKFDQET